MKRAFALLLGAIGSSVACGGGAFGSADDPPSQPSGGSSSGGSADGGGGKATSGSAHGGSISAGATSSGGSGTSGSAGDGPQGDGGEPGQMPSECPCDFPEPTCESGQCVARGPSMVKAGSFYVDSTEVTVAQYALFLEAKGDDTSGQAPECTWNDSFEPADSSDDPEHPVTHVDFCDAAAFCAWADKQLCGKIGGGALAFADLSLATKSQWVAACGGTKQQPFPYGTEHEAGACNDDSGSGHIEPVASFEACNGFYDGVFDMVGNVAEWVNACDAGEGASDGCITIGGTYADANGCTGSGLKHRDEQLPTVGFRCCSE